MSDRITIDSLTPADYNPREITEDNMQRLKRSIMEHSACLSEWDAAQGLRLVTTITVNRNGHRVVGGHQRLLALQELGQDWIHADDITWVDLGPGSAMEKALNLALNSEDASGRWEYEKLSALLLELDAEGLDLELTGLADFTIEPLLQADWSPPKIQDEADGDESGEAGTVGKPIQVTSEQREVIERAIAAIRTATDDPEMSEGRCLELICADYMASR